MRREGLAVVLAGALAVTGCLEDKPVDFVVTGEAHVDLSQEETLPEWSNSVLFDVGDELNDLLEENGFTREDIDRVQMTSVHYGVTEFMQAHDWAITGALAVTYQGNSVDLVRYDSQSLQDALAKKIPLELERDGVDLVNAALRDFVDGEETVVLIFSIINDSTAPVPSLDDPLVFDWRAWLAVQVLLHQTVRGVPDPF